LSDDLDAHKWRETTVPVVIPYLLFVRKATPYVTIDRVVVDGAVDIVVAARIDGDVRTSVQPDDGVAGRTDDVVPEVEDFSAADLETRPGRELDVVPVAGLHTASGRGPVG